MTVSLRLTADVDDVTGTANDDAFTAGLTVAGSQTLQNFDTIEGGEGNDTLNATLIGDAAPTLTGVENIFARSITNANELDLSNATGVEQLWSDRSQTNVEFSNVAEQVTVGVVEGNGTTLELGYANALTAADVQDIILEDADATLNLTNVAAANGFTIANTGDSKLATTSAQSLGSANIQNLAITGEGSLAISTAITAGVIDASAATADVDLTVADAAAGNQAAGTDRDVLLGSGDDVVDVSGLTSLAANVDSVDGGEGRDTIVVDGTSGTLVNDLATGSVSNFEVLNLGNVFSTTLSASVLGNIGFDELVVTDAGAGAGTINALNANSSVSLVNTDTTQDQVTLDLASGETDLTVSAEEQEATNTTNGFAITTNAENVTVDFVANEDSTGTTLDLEASSAGDIKTVTITGEEDVAFDATTATSLTGLETVDASALVGDATITVDNGETVTTGAGDDTIAVGVGSVVTGGAGDDTFSVSTGAAAAYNEFVTIEDFQAGDTIDFGGAVASVAEITEADLGLTPGTEATFNNYVDAATAGTAGSGEVSHFEFAGDTFLVQDNNAATSLNAADVIVKLSGGVDLSDLAADGNTVEIA